ncbi:MAG: pectinesterase family protein [Paludibacteraceae bacterium]
MKKTFLFSLLMMASALVMAGENDLLWDYTEAAPPSKGPDNGLYYGGIVDDGVKRTNQNLNGVKLNSSGYAYFEKAPVAGTLRLTISERKGTSEYKVDVCHGTLVDGTPTKGELIATTDAAQGPEMVSVELDETVTGIYICRNTSKEGVIVKIEFTERIPRDFTDFTIDLTQNPYTVPTGVSEGSYPDHGKAYNGTQHGWQWVVFGFKTDGPVKVSVGGCTYINDKYTAYVVSAKSGEKLADIDNKTVGCNGVATWIYTGGEDSLVVYCGQYCPLLKVEAFEIKPATLTYKDQNDNLLAKYDKMEGDMVGTVPDSINAKLQIPDGMRFRGWKYTTMLKAQPTDLLTGNTTIKAHVTPIEQAATGTHYKYDLTKNTCYMEDYDLITATGKQHNNHGYVFANGEEMTLIVSPKAYVSIGLCTYTETSSQIIRNAAGDSVSVMNVTKNTTTDGTLCSFYYANTDGKQDTLHFDFTTTSYIHFVEVYNVANPLSKAGHVYDIPAGDAAAFMLACSQLQDGDTILLHDGIYDLGKTALTTVSASHVVIKGESMNGTIIKNAPEKESIATTATILNTGSDNIFENLTLQNAFDYYLANDGRAVCLQDKGTRTACYNVRMLSYQDTYYSNKPGQQCWFEDCEIHGTVDFICGSGSVYFYNTLLYCEKRAKDGSGQDCITASNSQTAQQDKGYVFDRCTIQSECPVVSLSRSWNDQPQVAYLLTTLDMSKGEFGLNDSKIQRWTIDGMNNCMPYDFSEYSTMDTEGNIISPKSNKVQFFGKAENEKETIIRYKAAEAKSYIHFFRDGWTPARNYVDFPYAEDTAIQNTETASQQTTKVLVDGQLVIIRNGVRYSATGALLQ